MAQLSRPFQIALVAVVLLAGVWLFALQGRFTSTSGSGSSPAVSTTTPATVVARKPTDASTKAASSRAASTRSSAPTTSHGLPGSSARAPARHSSTTVTRTRTSTPAGTVTTAPTKAVTKAPTKAVTKTVTKAPTKAVTKAPAKTVTQAPPTTVHSGSSASATATLSGQQAVEADLAKGDVVVLLFWNPSGTDDVSVHRAVQAVKSANHVAVQEAAASQVASFGSVTRGVQVYTTPTILVIAKNKKAIVLTGVQDGFSIEQAIQEARSA